MGNKMDSKWKQVWNRKNGSAEKFDTLEFKDKILYLKQLDGFDSIHDKSLGFEAIMEQHMATQARLSFVPGKAEIRTPQSVYEVGCGSGADLYMFEQDGIRTGGIDYSNGLVDMAKKILNSDDILCDEAINIPEQGVYDCILSNSVFSYFPDFEYAENVLKKMLQKCQHSIAILDIHDEEKKEAFIEYRSKEVENYKELYSGLDKLFYPKSFFLQFAEKHNLDILFSMSDLKEYWNNNFIFNCFLYKRG